MSFRNIRITPYGSHDTVAFRLYYESPGTPVTLQSPYITLIEFPPGEPPVDGNGDVVVALEDVKGIDVLDGVYDTATRSVDVNGNVTGGFDNTAVPLDFVAPGAPTNVEFF